jgi:hypothetical protein
LPSRHAQTATALPSSSSRQQRARRSVLSANSAAQFVAEKNLFV